MDTSTRELPIGIQDFEKLRTENCLYADKTQYVYELTRRSRPYFLSRPRRFGKSLFLSTLKAYFEGKKAVFEGLAIAGMEQEWVKYPVFHIDFNVENCTDEASLHSALSTNLRRIEAQWGKDEEETTPAARLLGLILRACEKSGQKVVVLVDEYDKPLINTMDNPLINEAMRNILKGFYGVLKSADANLRFVFLTGVTKFSKVSIFSDLNQLQDISMDEDFAGICGISESELLHYFQPEIANLAQKQELTFEQAFAEMKKRYDGYHFAKVSEDMYNPFSVLNTLSKRDFGYYWFATGTPTFLAKALQKQHYDIRKLENEIEIPAISIMDYRAENEDLIPLLYQTGYLTIKSYDNTLDEYTLGFPNEEVKYGFLSELLPAFVLKPVMSGNFSVIGFLKQLMKNNIEGFMTLLQSFFAAIPYDAVKQEHRDEQYYQHVFYLLFTLMGQFVQTEVKSAVGRADAVVKTADSIYVFEFKMDSNATAEQALQQIDDKAYLIPYIADHRRLIKIGVEFSREERGVKQWLVVEGSSYIQANI